MFKALHNLCAFHIVRAELGVTAEFAGQLLAIGRQPADGMWMTTGHVLLSVAEMFAGRLALARESFAAARASASELTLRTPWPRFPPYIRWRTVSCKTPAAPG